MRSQAARVASASVRSNASASALAAGGANLRGQRLARASGRELRVQQQRRAVARQPARDRAAERAAGAGDERALPCRLSVMRAARAVAVIGVLSTTVARPSASSACRASLTLKR